MAGGRARGVWKSLEGLCRYGASGHLGDDELLGRFVAGRRDEAAESAFAALVERHGPMVLGVCRRVLGDRHEAEDAFQATFLVLARKAGAIARRERLACWLHGVASRTALEARARADRRRARERKATAVATATADPDDAPERRELRAILDEELSRLPESYRGPVILCELDGLPRRAAARRLGIPEGTLSSRLARGKDLLRDRLARRGLAPSAVALEATMGRRAGARIVPPPLADSTIEAAARVAAGTPLAGAVAAPIVSLTEGALRTMMLAKIKGSALALAAAAVVTTGVGVLAQAPGPVPTPGGPDDRLGAVEKKLDRILEALGGQRNTPGGTGMMPGRAGGDAANPPGTKSYTVDLLPTINDTATPTPGGAESGKTHLTYYTTTPTLLSEARIADMERRIADLERRLGAMERRIPRQSDDGADAPRGLPRSPAPGVNPSALPR